MSNNDTQSWYFLLNLGRFKTVLGAAKYATRHLLLDKLHLHNICPIRDIEMYFQDKNMDEHISVRGPQKLPHPLFFKGTHVYGINKWHPSKNEPWHAYTQCRIKGVADWTAAKGPRY